MRDNFSAATKRQLAERVAWRCSFAGCSAATIGPKEGGDEGIVNLGEAAHIHAASPLGPRHDETMTAEQRAAPSNGIWMCRMHARLIDADERAYTAETLKLWKRNAEARAHQELVTGRSIERTDTLSTLVLISNNVVFEAIWISASEKTWVFEILRFVEGTIEKLRDIVSSPVDATPPSHYLVVETQGDGRVLKSGSAVMRTENGALELVAKVAPPVKRICLAEMGSDMALDEDGDLAIEDGDFKLVSGYDLLKQQMTVVLSSQVEDFMGHPLLGSNFSSYYRQFHTQPPLLNKFLLLETARLASIPFATLESSFDQPTLNFIKRVERMAVIEKKSSGVIVLDCRLLLQDNAVWEGEIPVHIHHLPEAGADAQ